MYKGLVGSQSGDCWRDEHKRVPLLSLLPLRSVCVCVSTSPPKFGCALSSCSGVQHADTDTCILEQLLPTTGHSAACMLTNSHLLLWISNREQPSLGESPVVDLRDLISCR